MAIPSSHNITTMRCDIKARSAVDPILRSNDGSKMAEAVHASAPDTQHGLDSAPRRPAMAWPQGAEMSFWPRRCIEGGCSAP
eukprot:6733284-Pyramimonas_sp.AAC.1